MTNNSSGTNTSGNLFQTSLTTSGVVTTPSGGVLGSTGAIDNSRVVATNSSETTSGGAGSG